MDFKTSVIGTYVSLDAKQRVDFQIAHYRDFHRILDAYKEYVTGLMLDIREYERNADKNEGIPVQSIGALSDPTFREAIERILVNSCFDSYQLFDGMFEDPYEYELISLAMFEWELMKKENEEFNYFLRFILKPEDSELLQAYLSRRMRLKDIADKYDIEIESANKRIYRIRKKLVKRLTPHFYEYNIQLPA